MKARRGPFSNLHVLMTVIIVNRRISTSIINMGTLLGENIILVNANELGILVTQISAIEKIVSKNRHRDSIGILISAILNCC